MKLHFSLGFFLVSMISLAQTSPVSYLESKNPKPPYLASWKHLEQQPYIGFASADIRYEKEKAPSLPIRKVWKTKGWKGERVHTQLLVAGTRPLQQVNFDWGDLSDGKGNTISRGHISVNFVRYVLTDSLSRQGMGCGIDADLDSSLVEDVIDDAKYLDVAANTTQPAWITVNIPRAVPAGIYRGIVKVVVDKGTAASLGYSVEVLNRVLPDPKDWKFHLDLWQNPFSISRVQGVQAWSDEHMAALAPYMKMLAAAGQKVITASIIHDPWNSQTHDVYHSMIRWIKKKDGSWAFDYSIFDKWVAFMISLGIDKEINCYSMIPWNLKFYYYDEALGKDTLIIANPGTDAYELHWRTMLTNFASHLKTKGWFEKTTIAMDERPMEHMQIALKIIKTADKNFKVSMAGEYHKEIEAELSDYSVASKYILQKEVLDRRKKDGLVTTYYTACPEPYPNTFTFSPPAESAFLGWYAGAKDFDGFLRWAFNSWPENPLQDSRFGKWSGGDTYFIYPGPRSSIRFERLIEGIQAYEKLRILKDEFTKDGETRQLGRVKHLLRTFEIAGIKTRGAAAIVNEATDVLNGL